MDDVHVGSAIAFNEARAIVEESNVPPNYDVIMEDAVSPHGQIDSLFPYRQCPAGNLGAAVRMAVMLYRFREGDANMRSVWICSRNDAIGNLAVIAAAAGVFGTGTGWPDVIVAAIMASLSISGGWQIVRQSRSEIRSLQTA